VTVQDAAKGEPPAPMWLSDPTCTEWNLLQRVDAQELVRVKALLRGCEEELCKTPVHLMVRLGRRWGFFSMLSNTTAAAIREEKLRIAVPDPRPRLEPARAWPQELSCEAAAIRAEIAVPDPRPRLEPARAWPQDLGPLVVAVWAPQEDGIEEHTLCVLCEERSSGLFQHASKLCSNAFGGMLTECDMGKESSHVKALLVKRGPKWDAPLRRASVTGGPRRGLSALGMGSNMEKRSRAARLALAALACVWRPLASRIEDPTGDGAFPSLVAAAREKLGTSSATPATSVWGEASANQRAAQKGLVASPLPQPPPPRPQPPAPAAEVTSPLQLPKEPTCQSAAPVWPLPPTPTALGAVPPPPPPPPAAPSPPSAADLPSRSRKPRPPPGPPPSLEPPARTTAHQESNQGLRSSITQAEPLAESSKPRPPLGPPPPLEPPARATEHQESDREPPSSIKEASVLSPLAKEFIPGLPWGEEVATETTLSISASQEELSNSNTLIATNDSMAAYRSLLASDAWEDGSRASTTASARSSTSCWHAEWQRPTGDARERCYTPQTKARRAEVRKQEAQVRRQARQEGQAPLVPRDDGDKREQC